VGPGTEEWAVAAIQPGISLSGSRSHEVSPFSSSHHRPSEARLVTAALSAEASCTVLDCPHHHGSGREQHHEKDDMA
jgi:hypothetical protein